jgi:hypothetical protein
MNGYRILQPITENSTEGGKKTENVFFRQGLGIYFFTTASKQGVGPSQPPI